jgi:hypothetical protein
VNDAQKNLAALRDVAAAAAVFVTELECPAPDLTMRRVYRETLKVALERLPVETQIEIGWRA